MSISLQEYAEILKAAKEAITGVPQVEPSSSTRAGLAVVWDDDVRAKFVDWMRENGKDEEYIQKCVSYLDRYMRPLRRPQDVLEMFKACERGKHHLDRAVRNLLKFYERVLGFPKPFIDSLRAADTLTELKVLVLRELRVSTYSADQELMKRGRRARKPRPRARRRRKP